MGWKNNERLVISNNNEKSYKKIKAMKNIIYLILFISTFSFAQSKYLTKNGTIGFEASVPSFEEVKAENNTATAILNTENGEFAALVLIKGFRFKNALMEEHFNENYAESDKFPKATFKGVINDFDSGNLNKEYTINGTLTFHGKSKLLENIKIQISKNDELIIFSGKFSAKASDFDIDIPKIVRKKIAEDVEVSFKFELKKK